MERNWSRLFAAAVAAALVLAGCAAPRGGKLVEDPQGRFTYRASPDLQPRPADGGYDRYTLASPAMEVYVVAAEAPNEQAGRAAAFERIGKDFASHEPDGTTSFGEWRADSFRTAAEGGWAGLAWQYRGGTLYGLAVFGGGDSSPDTLPAPVAAIIGSFEFGEAAGEVFRPASFAELEGFIGSIAASFGGSISVAAVRDGRLVYRYAAGDRGRGLPAGPEVAYHWGSISKLATATAVLQQVEQGRLDLDTSIDAWFPGFPLGGGITVRHLLTHSAGLPSFEDAHLVAFGGNRLPDLASVLEGYWPRVERLVYEPGSRPVYHNWNFLILARLVEVASGEEFSSYVSRHVFTPAGMEGTAYTTAALAGAAEALPVVTAERLAEAEAALAGHGLGTGGLVAYRAGRFAHLQPVDILPAWAGVKGPAAEAALFGWLFLNGGEVAGRRVLDRSTVRKMLSMQKSAAGKPLGMGLAWHLGKQGREAFVEHGGGGPGIDSLLRLYPGRGLSIAVLGNMNGYGPGLVLEHTAALLSKSR